jgi:transcriptional regulator with XRE-family HTH domain
MMQPMGEDLYTLLRGATSVGDRIRRLMEKRDMTMSDLHRASGVAKGYLSELLSSENADRRKPSAETLYEIGQALGVSVGDLLGKTLPSPEEIKSWPPGLEKYVRAANVPPEEARMLAGIRARGKTPTTAEEWRLVHNTILMFAVGED